MRLYHYTNEHCARSILQKGITLGRLCLGEAGRMHGHAAFRYTKEPYQWLTDFPDHMHGLERSYRNWRVIVDIPDDDANLMSPREWKKAIRPMVHKGSWGMYTLPFNDHSWLYAGTIPPEWIAGVEEVEP